MSSMMVSATGITAVAMFACNKVFSQLVSGGCLEVETFDFTCIFLAMPALGASLTVVTGIKTIGYGLIAVSPILIDKMRQFFANTAANTTVVEQQNFSSDDSSSDRSSVGPHWNIASVEAHWHRV
jgi:hypothetical protein